MKTSKILKSLESPKSSMGNISDTLEFNSDVYNSLPKLFREAINPFDTEYKGMMLMSFLTSISSILWNVKVGYQTKWLHPNLFTIIIGRAATGKNNMTWAKYLVSEVENTLEKESIKAIREYKSALRKYEKGETSIKPEEPPYELLLISTDITSAALIEQLKDNEGRGLMFDTEIDALVESSGNKLRGLSDTLRKIFEDEAISVMRKTDKVRIKINEVSMSLLLSGTPKQFHKLIPDSENGLFSRVIPYRFYGKSEWISSNPKHTIDYKVHFGQLSLDVLNYFEYFRNQDSIECVLSDKQYDILDKEFRKRIAYMHGSSGADGQATLFRLGSITVKIASILTIIRLIESNKLLDRNVCSDADFVTSMYLSRVLLNHSLFTLKDIKEIVASSSMPSKKLDYLYELPLEFKFKESQKIAVSMGIKPKTAEKWLSDFKRESFVISIMHNHYKKLINI